MNKEVYIVDSTLRDGEQSPNKVFSIKEKLEIARFMDFNKIYQIEGGIPSMGTLEKDIIIQIIDEVKYSKVSTWNRLNKKDILDSLDCRPDIIHISVPTSDIQIYSNLNKDRSWIDKNIIECVYFAKSKGYDVTVGFEDASRADIKYLIHLCNILEKIYVNRVRYADTVGILTPSLTKEAITKLREYTSIDIEMHTHNDFGMAIANSIEGVKCGAKYVNCTLEGIGERAGNCDLKQFVELTKNYFYNLNSIEDIQKIG